MFILRLFVYDNETCYKLYETAHFYQGIDTTYYHINHLVGQVLSAMSCCQRWSSQIGCDIHQFQTNLVPFPSINLVIVLFFCSCICDWNSQSQIFTVTFFQQHI